MFKRTKIPYRTIAACILFFIVGSYFVWQGISNYVNDVRPTYNVDGERIGAEPWELIVLGMLMFIPGSYHVFVALMACCEQPGYTYKDVSAYETDEWHNESD